MSHQAQEYPSNSSRLNQGYNKAPRGAHAPLDGVALPVCLPVEGRWPAALAAPSQPVSALVSGDGDHCPDAALAQVLADRAGRVRLVRQDHVRSGAWPSSVAGNPQAGHDIGEGRCVADLACGQDERQRLAAVVGSKVDLCGQSAPGPADGMVIRFAGRGPFLRAPAACW